MSSFEDGGYVPIACAFHECLEFAVLRRQRLRMLFRSSQGETLCTVLPTDVQTRDGAEWLHYLDETGKPGQIRLDFLVSAEPCLE